jgi:hypothetical protein
MKRIDRRSAKGRIAKSVLRLPDLEVAKSAVLSNLLTQTRSGAIATQLANLSTAIANSAGGSKLRESKVERYSVG